MTLYLHAVSYSSCNRASFSPHYKEEGKGPLREMKHAVRSCSQQVVREGPLRYGAEVFQQQKRTEKATLTSYPNG